MATGPSNDPTPRLSAQALSDRCAELGADIPRNAVSNLENGRKIALPIHEVVVLAAALGVAPRDLLFPPTCGGDTAGVPVIEYLPGDLVSVPVAWRRFNHSDEPDPYSGRIAQARAMAQRIMQTLDQATGSGDATSARNGAQMEGQS